MMVNRLPTLSAAPKASKDKGAPFKGANRFNKPSRNVALSMLADSAFSGSYGKDAKTSALLIIRDRQILLERALDDYRPETTQRTWSVAKSIAATIIGAAVHDGLIALDAPADIAEWIYPADPRRMIKVVDLMHMMSGLDSNRAGNRTDRLYLGGGLVSDTSTEFALEATPGTRWKYANNDTLLMMAALRSRFKNRQAYIDYPYERLLKPLGMDHTYLETDWAGDFILSSQVWTSARDLARLGQLLLQDGVWDDERLLPAGWLATTAEPAPDQPALTTRSGEQRAGYGKQWWLYGKRHGLPEGTLAARGNRGQILMLIPEHDLIIVRRGYDPAGGVGFKADRFAVDLMKALGL